MSNLNSKLQSSICNKVAHTLVPPQIALKKQVCTVDRCSLNNSSWPTAAFPLHLSLPRPLPTFLAKSGTLSTAPVVLKLWLISDSAGVSQTIDCWAPPPEFLNQWVCFQFSRSGVSRFFATPWTTAHQASLSITNSWSLLKLMSIKSVMPSSHLILCRPLLLLPSIFPSIRVFPNESVLLIRWPDYWSFSFSISPSNEYSGLISFRVDWLGLHGAPLCAFLTYSQMMWMRISTL